MASFDNSNDIKIQISLDTDAALQAAQELKAAIEGSIKATADQFKQLQQITKQLQADLKTQTKQVTAETKQQLDAGIKNATDAANKEVAIADKAAKEKARIADRARKAELEAQKNKIRELEALVRQEGQRLSTERTQLLKNIAELNLQRTIAKKAPKAEFSPELGGIASSGKLVEAFKNSIAGLSLQFGNVNVGFGAFIENFKNLGIVGGAIAGIAAATGAIQRLDQQIDQLAERAGRLEGLKTGFETLQRTIAQDPTASIQRLREATQGLISDVDLYQRANQAVLLGVPTDTFNEAAAAAVKLGRAMGIDAALGLESLSLGLGRQSRLYLDNLGIIVSAEEAYQNFAATVNKSATDLTDGEKKAAFFAEALKKIKERADELPDPLDTVGVLLQKLAAAQANASEKFSEGINKSSELAAAYREQIAIQQRATESSQFFGEVVAKIAAPIKGLANDLRLLGVIGKEAVVGIADIFTDIGPEENLVTAQKNVEKLKEGLNALYEERTRTFGGSDRVNSNIKVFEGALKLAEAQVRELTLEVKKLRGEVDEPFKFKVDLSEILRGQSVFETFISDLRKGILEEAGTFEVPGIDPETIKSATAAVEELTFKTLQAKGEFAGFSEEFDKISQKISFDLLEKRANQLGTSISALKTQYDNLTEEQQKNVEVGGALERLIKTQTQYLAAAVKEAELSEEQQKALTKALDAGRKAAKKRYDESIKNSQKSIKQIDKEREALEDFAKSIRKSLNRAIPDDFQKELVDLFKNPTLSADQLAQAVLDLGLKFREAKGDVDAFVKEAAKLADLKLEGPITQPTADEEKANRQRIEDLKELQKQSVNLRDIVKKLGLVGEGEGGAFFGFDIGSIDQATEANAAMAFQQFFSDAMQSGIDGFNREDVRPLTASLFSSIGGAIGFYLGGPAGAQLGSLIGDFIGDAVGKSLEGIGKDLEGTRARKDIDSFFAELFDGDRLAIIINDQVTSGVQSGIEQASPQIKRISDLVFEGTTPFAGDVDFGGENFRNYFSTLSAEIQSSFTGVGVAFGALLGQTEEQSILIGIAIANNIGGNLKNLQILVQQTGKTFEELGSAIIKAFVDGKLSIDQAYNSLIQIKEIFEDGISGVRGGFDEAAKNLKTAIEDGKAGALGLQSIRDVAAELKEVGVSDINTFVAVIGKAFNFTAEQTNILLQNLKANGINTIQDVLNLGKDGLIGILKFVENAKAGISEVAALPTASTAQPVPDFTPIRTTASQAGKSINDAKNKAKQFREEVQRLLRESQTYLDIVNKIAAAEISRAAGGAQIIALQRQIADALKERNSLESQYAKELARGAKANTDRLGRLAAALDAVNKKIDGFTKKATEGFKALDISGIIPLIKSANSLGVVARITGVDLEKVTDILVQGFLRGKLTLEQFNEQLKKTQDNLGKGIPNEIGAVTKAFQNLVDAGVQGGAFSVDAFTDIFAEFREKFQQQSSVVREQQRKDLIAALENAKAAQRAAVGPEAAQAAQKAVDAAKKALDDFYNTIPSPNLSDLRAELEATFGVEEVAKFFQAIDESGLNSFQDLENAGSEAIVKILARLAELGFNFNQTSDEIQNVNNGLNDAANAASGGLDPLKEAIELVKQFNEGAGSLPPAFNSTTQAIAELNGPLSALATGFDNIIEKLGRLSGNEFRNDVIFNVRTVGDAGSQGLVEILFGDGADASASTGNGAPVSGGSSGGGGGSSSRTRSRDRFVRVGPGRWKNLRTGRVVNSTKNPGR